LGSDAHARLRAANASRLRSPRRSDWDGHGHRLHHRARQNAPSQGCIIEGERERTEGGKEGTEHVTTSYVVRMSAPEPLCTSTFVHQDVSFRPRSRYVVPARVSTSADSAGDEPAEPRGDG